MQPVKYGVIGCGVIGPTHMQAAAAAPELLDLVAVADLIPDRAARAAADFHAGRTYGQGADLIDDPEIELVVLALPTCHRKALALRAFERGKHVLIEKPVAMNAGDVEELIAARGDLQAACCSSRYRFLPGADVARGFIAAGGLGKVRRVHQRAFSPAAPPPTEPRPEWRLKRHLNGGGYLMNWGCYDLDYLMGLTGWTLMPARVFAQTWQVAPQLASHLPEGSDGETHYTALIRCQDGVAMSIERGEYMPIQTENAWQIIGERGSLRLTMTHASPRRIYFDEATTADGYRSTLLWEGEDDPAGTSIGPVTDLACAIREGRAPATSLEQALVVQRITDAIYESSATGEVVCF